MGAPDTTRVVRFRVTPLGSAGLNVYVKLPSPPLANGSVNDDIDCPPVQTLSPIVCTPNVGTPSTSMSNVNSTASPSASVALHVYSVLDFPTPGVPLTSRVVASRLTPLGSAGLNVYVKLPSPPVAAGSVNDVIPCPCVQLLSPID